MADAGFAEIIPLVKLPRKLGVFDYKIPQELEHTLKIGMGVEVPFRGRTVPGVVSGFRQDTASPADRILEITRANGSETLIDSQYLTFLCETARELITSPALLLRSVLPKIPRRISPVARIAKIKPRPITLPRFLLPKLNTALSSLLTDSSVFFRIDDSRLLIALITRLALDAERNRGHLRILVPLRGEMISLSHLLNQFGVRHTRTLPTDGVQKTYDVWQGTRAGAIPVLVGTRAAIWFPYPPGSVTVLIDEDAEAWKQGEMNPRYDARRILRELIRLQGGKVCFTGPMPRMEILAEVETRAVAIMDLRVHEPGALTVLDFNLHLRAGNRGTVSDALANAIAGNRKAILYVHRSGSASVLYCHDCRVPVRCASCSLPLSVHRAYLRCSSCARKSAPPDECSNCHGARLIPVGSGTERVEEELRNRFPERRILRLDGAVAEIEPEFSPDSSAWDILIANQLLFSIYPGTRRELPSPDLVGIVEADTLLHRADFRAEEKLALIVSRIRQIANRSKAHCFIQTSVPEHPVWSVETHAESIFFDGERALRTSLHYPPFWRMAKLIFQARESGEMEIQASGYAAQFKRLITQGLELEIVGPYPATPPRVRGACRSVLLLRFPPSHTGAVLPHLQKLTDDIIVDIDPIDLLK